MPKKENGKEGVYYVYLDVGIGVKLHGLDTHFKQGEPHKIPELFIEDAENNPLFAKVKDGEKKLTPTECKALRKTEMEKKTEARDAWRKERAAGKTGKPINAPPADVPTLGVKQDE